MAVFVFEIVSEPEISKIATISSPFKWRNRMSKLYCVECPFPGGGNSSDNSPWIAVLLRAFHNISGYAVAFFFSQFLLRAPLSANATAKHRLKRKIASHLF